MSARDDHLEEFTDRCVDLVLQLAERKCTGAGRKSCIQRRRPVRCAVCQAQVLKLFADSAPQTPRGFV